MPDNKKKFISKENLLSILTDFKTKISQAIQDALPTKLSELTNDTKFVNETQLSDKADETLQSAKDYTDAAIGGIIQFKIEKVVSLPDVGDAKENTIYLVPIAGASSDSNNIYDEYLLIDSKWEHLGTTEVDLTNYYNKEEVDKKITDAAPTEMSTEEIEAFNTQLWQ